jgi:hypothetical protein
MNDLNEPAFPCPADRFPDGVLDAQRSEGMSLRDYFAAKAMAAMTSDMERSISLCTAGVKAGHGYAMEVALQSYDMADAMLEARNMK